MNEMRSHPRYPVFGQPAITNWMSGSVLGSLTDLSSGGGRVATSAPIRLRSLFQIHFQLGPAGSDAGTIDAGIQVRWLSTGPGESCREFGFRFIDLPDSALEALAAWLAERTRAG